jgi:hypothetical protein
VRCILHIGSEKTGSKAIQRAGWRGKETLAQFGIAISDVAGRSNNRKLAAYLQPRHDDGFYKDNRILTEQDRRAFFAGFEDDLAAEFDIARRAGQSVLLTSEFFHSRLTTPDSIAALKHLLDRSFDDCLVIVYLREQSALLRSAYSTSVKSGDSRDFAQFAAAARVGNPYYDHLVAMRPWRDVFGKDRLNIRIYDRDHLRGGDILTDFYAIVAPGLDVARLPQLAEDTNAALGNFGLAIGRRINAAFPRYKANGEMCDIRYHLAQALIQSDLGRSGGTAIAEAQEIHDRFDAANRAFAREFLGRDDNPFQPPRPRGEEGIVDLARMTTQIDDFAAALMNELRQAISPPTDDRPPAPPAPPPPAPPPAARGLVERIGTLVRWPGTRRTRHRHQDGPGNDPA